MTTPYTFESVRPEVEEIRRRIERLRRRLAEFFVAKQEVVDLMMLCTFAQEPLLLVGKPGTAKSDLIVKFVQALGVTDSAYFEYMLTKFTEVEHLDGDVYACEQCNSACFIAYDS